MKQSTALIVLQMLCWQTAMLPHRLQETAEVELSAAKQHGAAVPLQMLLLGYDRFESEGKDDFA